MHVVANVPPALNLDADSSTIGGVDYLTTFADGGPAVAIVDTDVLITDSDDIELTSATVTLTNPAHRRCSGVQRTPRRPASRLPSTIPSPASSRSLAPRRWPTYQAALRQITFDNTGTNPSTETRIIDVVVNDGTAASNMAHAIIDVVQVNDSAPTSSISTATIRQSPERASAPRSPKTGADSRSPTAIR